MKRLEVLIVFTLGLAFGLLLSRSGAADYSFIQEMFLFESFQLYGIIGSAVLIAAPGLWLLERHGKTASGEPLKLKRKPLHGGTVIGGIFFGIGWSLTGMCPGPILINIGEGKLYALAALAGALIGAWAFGALYPRLQPLLGLPPVDIGTGEG